MSKLKLHYILLSLAISVIFFSLIFYFYTKDDSYVALAFMACYLLGYVLLWLYTHFRWNKKGKINTANQKIVYPFRRFIAHFTIFIIVFILFIFTSIWTESLLGNYLELVYFFVLYFLFVFMAIMPFFNFLLQEKYQANKVKIFLLLNLFTVLFIGQKYLELKMLNRNLYVQLPIYILYALYIKFVYDFFHKLKNNIF